MSMSNLRLFRQNFVNNHPDKIQYKEFFCSKFSQKDSLFIYILYDTYRFD